MHHPHHSQQGPPPTQHLQHPRSSSIVHHQQGPPAQHQNAYPSNHGLPQQQYGQSVQGPAGHHPQDINPYYGQPSPYSTPSATGTYNSSAAPETPEIMAAAQMSRPAYPSIYQTPQSNSPASVASPSGHDQHGRSMYGQPGAHLQHQPMYYPPQQQYPSMPPQGGPSPYAPHPQQQHQTMTSQPSSLLMSHQGPQHPMQHQGHPQQQQQMTSSPRTKMEHVPQLQRPASGQLGPPPQQQQHNGPPMGNSSVPGSGVNANAAPGPIPATTPLVVRQDGNGTQWIAFEYSRDRVKMEYTIRCDVETVNVDTLSAEFKTENCVYPRACCSKDQYRGNRLVYETECNTVGWALAELNPSLRGKRGLIQRAVDSWRNSNQDPRLRSRRVRRMAKINTRKAVQAASHPHMPGPQGSAGMPPAGSMGPSGGAGNMGKPGMGGMQGAQIHHHHAHPGGSASGPDDGSGDGNYIDEDSHHHHHHATVGQVPPSGSAESSIRQAVQFSGYPGQYPPHNSGGASVAPQLHDGMAPMNTHSSSNAIAAKAEQDSDNASLFGVVPEGKGRKFIVVHDDIRGGRVRVRVTLDTVNPKEIPDSYRKSNSVFPRSWFPIEMQSPPPSANGSRFFLDDDNADEDGASGDGPSSRGKTFVRVPLPDGTETSLAAPRIRKSQRMKEVKINELGYRMTWHQSRVFAGRTVFLQKALDCYRTRVAQVLEGPGGEGLSKVPHFETRVGKRRLGERRGRGKDT